MIKAGRDDIASSFLATLTHNIESLAEDREPSKTIKPSSIACERQCVFQILGKPGDNTTPSDTSTHITTIGSYIHQVMQGYIHKTMNFIDVGKYVKDNNIPLEIVESMNAEEQIFETKLFDGEHGISFLCDGIVEYRNKLYILEIKTVNPQEIYKLEAPHEKYLEQATIYSQLLRVPDVLFLYVDRAIGQKKCFLFTPTSEQIRNIWAKIDNINEHIRNNTIPPKPSQAGNKFCQYCRYKGVCDEQG